MVTGRQTAFALSALAALFALSAAAWSAIRIADGGRHFADADDGAKSVRGARLYRRQCGGCHGGQLQGQPFWRLVDADWGRRAPALNQSGRAWRRSDEDLFHVVKYGRYPEKPKTENSHMPAFEGDLEDQDILAVLAFVKGRWPIGQRALQATRNPGQRGMPAQALTTDWRLPPDCFSPDVAAVAKAP